MKIGRNDPCSCGSGKKYKKCCLGKPAPVPDGGEFVLEIIPGITEKYEKCAVPLTHNLTYDAALDMFVNTHRFKKRITGIK